MPWAILDAGAPCVVVDRDLGETPVDQVLVDNDQGGYLAGEHLIGLGHRRIACLVGPDDLTPSAGRIAGFQRALADAGLAVAAEGLVRGNGRSDGGAAAARQLPRAGCHRRRRCHRDFAFNDQMAIGAIGALQRAGCRVPEDVSVVGFDDIPQSAAIFPALTTIAQPIGEMGRSGPAPARSHCTGTGESCPVSAGAACHAAGRAGEHGAASGRKSVRR